MTRTRGLHILINLLALSVAITLGVDFFYRMLRLEVTRADLPLIRVTAEPHAATPRSVPLTDIRVIVDRNLFGVERDSGSPAAPETPSPTELKLALLGTVTGSPQRSFAVIEELDSRRQQLYRVGDTVQRAVVKRILRGEVILRIDGRDETLTIDEATAVRLDVEEPATDPAAPVTEIVVTRKDLAQSLTNMNALLSELRIRPHVRDGQDAGFQVLWIKPGSFFLRLGLRDGDVIQGFNGRTIRSPDDMLALYQGLTSGTPIVLEITRKGSPKTLNYRFE